ncbi:MAG TPA: IPT/TIG domain-containing protein [Longimicrobium sp.]|nr:IPT/TIG domain-containing protein [Longimicrobium sp.]
MSNGNSSAPGPGKGPANTLQITGLAAALLLMIAAVFVLLIQLWPHPTPSTAPDAGAASATTRTPTATRDSSAASGTPSDSARDSVALALVDSTAGTQTSSTPRRPPDGAAARTSAPSPTDPCEARVDSLRRAWAQDRKPTPADCVRVFWGRPMLLWDEQRLLILVMLGGALGSLLHALRSLGWYIGNRELVKSWIPRYFFLAFVGAALASVFYVVVRGGFFSPGTSVESTSPFGFLAFAMLVGLFSEQAILKLKDVAESLLSKPKEGRDPAPPQDGTAATPAISSVTSVVDATGAPTGSFKVKGSGFDPQSAVKVNGVPQPFSYVDSGEIVFTPSPPPAAGTLLTVEVINPGGASAQGTLQL